MPDCLTPSGRLNALSLKDNIPVSVTAELTRRCPLACRHCYLPETRGRAAPGRELGTAAWRRILEQVAEAGGLYLVFTGGEPLLRPDLPELCRAARRLNFDVRVFSTGLGLNPGLASEFRDAGVSAFELSLYGPPAAHDAVTGLRGSCRRTLAAARLLRGSGVKVKLKTPLTALNAGSAPWLRRLAAAEGFGISFDPVLAPGNDGDPGPLALRLKGKKLSAAVKGLVPRRAITPAAPSPGDFICGAGRNVCAVGPDGALYPCLQLPVKLGALPRQDFARLWKNSPWLKKWRRARVADLAGCRDCRLAAWCSRCPGVSLLESGDLQAPNAQACAAAAALAGVYR